MIRDPVTQVKPAEPAIREVQMHLFAQPPFGPDAEAIPHQQHPDQQFGIDRRAACVAVETGKMGADAAQVDEPINGAKKMVLRNMTFQRELGPNIAQFSRWSEEVNQQLTLRSSTSFSTK
jgi:hypothetical protein